jgi:hypothetical protein
VEWQVLILRDVKSDVAGFRSLDPLDVEAAIREPFEDPFRGPSILKEIKAGASSRFVDRFSSSKYQPSIRLQILHDYRALAFCFIDGETVAIVTHVFHKSRDPDYKSAAVIHEARLGRYFDTFNEYVRRNRK